jgi:26S proteasome regulatory subunit N1
LAAEIGEEYAVRQESNVPTDDLHALALRLIPFFLGHNGEADAVDLLLELESISSIIPFVDEDTYPRVCLYMVSCVSLLVPPDDHEFLRTARTIYRKFNRLTEAITVAMRLNDKEMIKEDFESAKTM